jgi:hypothetical protein
MVRHVFLVENRLAVRHRPGQPHRHSSPVRLASTDNLITAGMSSARYGKIMRIERLVTHERVTSALPRPHQGRRNRSRSRPHGYVDASRYVHSPFHVLKIRHQSIVSNSESVIIKQRQDIVGRSGGASEPQMGRRNRRLPHQVQAALYTYPVISTP